MKFAGTAAYLLPNDLTFSVDAAAASERLSPAQREPGVGKKELARRVANAIGLAKWRPGCSLGKTVEKFGPRAAI